MEKMCGMAACRFAVNQDKEAEELRRSRLEKEIEKLQKSKPQNLRGFNLFYREVIGIFSRSMSSEERIVGHKIRTANISARAVVQIQLL